jgi:hypothetical protein
LSAGAGWALGPKIEGHHIPSMPGRGEGFYPSMAPRSLLPGLRP